MQESDTPSENGYLTQDNCFSTKAIHSGQEPEQWNSGDMTVPISLSTTFKHSPDTNGFSYSRCGNPTRISLEKCLAALEQGEVAVAYSSGSAALASVCHLLKSGDHVVAMDDLYGGTFGYFTKIVTNHGLEVSFVDARDLEAVRRALKANTKLVWIETPTNPTMKIIDIQALSSLCHDHDSDIIVACDNTFMSPYFQKPLLLGADLVVHSLSKYVNGHSDVIMGCVVTSHEDLGSRLKFLQSTVGNVPSPFDCYMVLRGIKTLELRMRQHMSNGMKLASFLEGHPCVLKVLYPGLKSHPQYDLAVKQSYGVSGMMSFYIKGSMQESKTFLDNLKLFSSATSLGGTESLAKIPFLFSQDLVSPEQRKALGINESLVRLSVGLENIDGLIEDVDQALRKAVEGSSL